MDSSAPPAPAGAFIARDSPTHGDQAHGRRRRNARTSSNLPPGARDDAPREPAAYERDGRSPSSRGALPARKRSGGRSVPPDPPATRCVRSVAVVPVDWPVSSREGIATAVLREVDRRGDERLVCDGLHDGPHFWPDVEPSPPIWDAELDASLADPGASWNRSDADDDEDSIAVDQSSDFPPADGI